jgi:hypothetical protein
MALVLKDRVKETTTTTGTGTLTLLGASTGYQAFSAIGDGNTCYYAIATTGSAQWEVGIGTYTASGTTLSRDTILDSSTGGGAIDLAAGTKEVFVTYPSEKAVFENASGDVVQNQFTSMNVTGTATINVATLTSGTISTGASNATDIVNKAYVDNAVAAGTHFHEPVRVESPINLNATYDNGTDGVGATLTNAGTQVALVIDGITMVVADRVLVYEQTNQTQNGVYVVTSIGSGATNWVLTRSDDANTYVTDSPDGLSEGSTFFVQEGATGAGETYTCNTQGVITFGTTDITFAQISSAQIYSAGTGLNLSGTTFSLANTTVTPATYGSSGQVAQIAINAQGQITSASNVGIAITASNVSGLAASATTDTTNASNITTGTLANARTTASANNGASTIVARDASGNFAAAGITATTFTGNGALITALNGTAITTGTVANDRTTAATANGASTIVARDASGNFSANVITANGSALTALNATAITSGTIPNANTTAASANGASTIVARDASGNFVANVITANGSALTALNATAITTGTLSNDRTTAASANGASTIIARDASGNFTANTATLTTVTGAGSGLTTLNATALTSGTVPDARFPATLPAVSGVNLTSLNASNIASGTLANGRTTAVATNGASTIVARDASGNFAAGTITAALTGTASNATVLQTARNFEISGGATASAVSFNGSAGVNLNVTAMNASLISTGTLANARTTAASANGASTIVARDASGNFTANVGTFTTVTGAGSGLTSLNASNISSGTVPTARLGSGTANATTFLRGDSTYATVAASPAGSNTQVQYNNAGSFAGSANLTFDGTNLVCGGNITANSDEKLKTNWRSLGTDFIEELAQVKSGIYDRIDMEATQAGVSAQSLEKVLSEVVITAPDGIKSVNYGNAALVACIELAKQVVELKKELNKLRSK